MAEAAAFPKVDPARATAALLAQLQRKRRSHYSLDVAWEAGLARRLQAKSTRRWSMTGREVELAPTQAQSSWPTLTTGRLVLLTSKRGESHRMTFGEAEESGTCLTALEVTSRSGDGVTPQTVAEAGRLARAVRKRPNRGLLDRK